MEQGHKVYLKEYFRVWWSKLMIRQEKALKNKKESSRFYYIHEADRLYKVDEKQREMWLYERSRSYKSLYTPQYHVTIDAWNSI